MIHIQKIVDMICIVKKKIRNWNLSTHKGCVVKVFFPEVSKLYLTKFCRQFMLLFDAIAFVESSLRVESIPIRQFHVYLLISVIVEEPQASFLILEELCDSCSVTDAHHNNIPCSLTLVVSVPCLSLAWPNPLTM